MDFNNFSGHCIALFKRIGLILGIFTFSRLLFLIVNWASFQPFDFKETFYSFLYGIRFDFIVIFYLNIIFILLHLFPFRFIGTSRSQKVLKSIIVSLNALLLLLNFIDIPYFKYVGKRSGWEMLHMLYTSTDTTVMVPQYIIKYWYLVIIWALSVAVMVKFYAVYKKPNESLDKKKPFNKILSFAIALLLTAGGLAFARGLNVKPVRIITANDYVSPKYIPLLLNTPFTILNTINQHKETFSNIFPLEKLEDIYSPVHKQHSDSQFRPMNVIIIILESFGKEYFEARSENGSRIAPFLDSLSNVGLYCTNAFANAKRSIDAMPPILGGFPSLLQTSFVSSVYSVNTVHGLASILKEKNYHTAFFHGGKNGTMGFDMFSKSVGFDEYYGKREYNNDKDYDGSWGIWDEEFFQFLARTVNGFKQPFFSVIFSLSSHDPYHLPDRYQGQFFPNEPKILRTVAYTDFALKRFFTAASKMEWYSNTLFVICPDHTSVAFDRKYKTAVGRVSIPIIYFCPLDTSLHGKYSNVTQQLDIMPTILDYLHYTKAFTAFGKSIFTKGYRFSVSFNDINFQIVDSTNCLIFDGNKTIRLNNFRKDPLLMHNISSKDVSTRKQLENILESYLQDYFYRLNNNMLSDTSKLGRNSIGK